MPALGRSVRIDRAVVAEYGAIHAPGGVAADVAAAYVARQRRKIPLERRAVTAAAARAQNVGVPRLEHLIERLAVREMRLLGLAVPVQRDRIAQTRVAAVETPRLALHAIHLRREADVVERLHHLLGAETAAMAAGAAGVRPQRVALDQQRIFRLDLLGG